MGVSLLRITEDIAHTELTELMGIIITMGMLVKVIITIITDTLVMEESLLTGDTGIAGTIVGTDDNTK